MRVAESEEVPAIGAPPSTATRCLPEILPPPRLPVRGSCHRPCRLRKRSRRLLFRPCPLHPPLVHRQAPGGDSCSPTRWDVSTVAIVRVRAGQSSKIRRK